MKFSESKAIYHQIADYICNQILVGTWHENQRILSVRELGVLLEVNPNTVLRAYDYLQNFGIISNKRGIGYFASEDAVERIKSLRRKHFVEIHLPTVFAEMNLLGIGMDELDGYYNDFLNRNNNEKSN